MKYIYSRVSTDKQSCDGQVGALKELYPDAQVHEETASGVKARPVLASLFERLRPGDMLIAWSLDRLGRRTSEILVLLEQLETRGVVVRTQREGVDMSTPIGKLIVSVLLSVAQLERDLISERTKVGLAAKRAQGIVGGRRPTITAEQLAEIRQMRAKGMQLKAIAAQHGVSVARISQLCKL